MRLRHALDPTAWVVLEELWLVAEHGERAWTAAASARSLASDLRLNPATVAKAIHRLRDAGLVSLVRSSGAGGRFGLSAYTLAAVDGILRGSAASPAGVPSTAKPSAETPYVAPPSAEEPPTAGPGAAKPAGRRRARPASPADGVGAPIGLFASLPFDGPAFPTTPGSPS